MLTGWKARLGQSRISLVLQLLVVFTLIVSSLNALLGSAVENKRAELNSLHPQWSSLQSFASPQRLSQQNAAPFYAAAVELCSAPARLGKAEIEQLFSFSNSPNQNAGLLARSVANHPAEAARLMTTFQPMFTLLDMAHQRNGCDFGIRHDLGYQAKSPDYLAMRQLFRALDVRSALQLNAHDWPAFSAGVAQQARWLRRLDGGPTIIGYFIRQSGVYLMLGVLEGAPADALDLNARNELQLLTQQLKEDWNRARVEERLCAEQAFDALRSGGKEASAVRIYGYDAGLFGQACRVIGGKTLLYVDELAFLHFWGRQLQDPHLAPPSWLSWFVIAHELTPNLDKGATHTEQTWKRLDALLAR